MKVSWMSCICLKSFGKRSHCIVTISRFSYFLDWLWLCRGSLWGFYHLTSEFHQQEAAAQVRSILTSLGTRLFPLMRLSRLWQAEASGTAPAWLPPLTTTEFWQMAQSHQLSVCRWASLFWCIVSITCGRLVQSPFSIQKKLQEIHRSVIVMEYDEDLRRTLWHWCPVWLKGFRSVPALSLFAVPYLKSGTFLLPVSFVQPQCQ